MRVDQAPFDDVKVRQAMRLIVDRQAMIDQTLSGYGSLGNDLYAPLDVDLRQRPAPARAGHRAGQVAARRRPAQEGLQVELFTGDDIGSVAVPAANLFAEQAKAAGVEVKVTKKTAVLRRRLPVLHRSPRTSGTPATTSRRPWSARSRRTRAAPTTRRTGTTQQHRDLVNAAAQELDEAKRADLLHQAQEIEYDEGGLIIWGFRQQVDGYAANVQGLEPSKYLPLGNYKFNKVSV